MRRASLMGNGRAPRNLLLRTFLFLLLGLVGGGAAAGADVQNGPVASVGPGPQFAIADFDGDLRPDLASIQDGRSDSTRTDYWIQLQFTAVGRQSIRIVAPVGGLQISARDVNGDNVLDLVLTATRLKEPVAILLNDGHGNFSRVDPASFPAAFSQSDTNWASAIQQVTDSVGVPPQSRAGICSETMGQPHPRSQTGFVALPSSGFPFGPSLIFHLGRAPPSEVPSL